MINVFDEKTQKLISQEFSRTKGFCYLDHAGATLYSETQIRNVCDNLVKNIYGNPHSLNRSSKQTSDLIDQIRNRILKFFHTTNDEYTLIFTSGATQAIKILLENFNWEVNHENVSESGALSSNNDTESGIYVYTQSNHTSVVGGREIAKEKGIPFLCIGYEKANSLMLDKSKPMKKAPTSNSLFAYPAQCNFSGKKFPLEWIQKVQNGILDSCGLDQERRNSKWFCLLDAATYCATNDLNLSAASPDFVCISFYKIFGYPTGLGALLVKNSSVYVLNKTYFGGGTVEISLPSQNFHKKRTILHERFEDGTISYLSIISLEQGLNTFNRLNLNMILISNHVFQLAKYTVQKLKTLTHWNGTKAVKLYADSNYDNITTQGGIVNFNLKRSNGQYIGFVEVLHIADLKKIHIRTGCFCNSGACQRHLQLTDIDLMLYHKAGHICGDSMDLIDGKPTGSIRISFGYMTTKDDVDKLIGMIEETFVERASPIISHGQTIKSENMTLSKILLYPIKSCGAMEVNSWKLNKKGLEYDREWMIITESEICLTQKQEPKLCLVHPKLNLVNQSLTISFYSDEDSITISIENNSSKSKYNLRRSKICSDFVNFEDCGDEVAEWLSHRLNHEGLRLVRQARSDLRKLKKSENDQEKNLSLANQAQYLLINNESVRWLSQCIEQENEIDIDTFPDRFRGNFYINGCPEFLENTWTKLKIGNIEFRVEGPCGRCQMICIDQRTGEKNRKPLVALSKALNGKLQFGIYLSHTHTCDELIISVGDCITTENNNS